MNDKRLRKFRSKALNGWGKGRLSPGAVEHAASGDHSCSDPDRQRPAQDGRTADKEEGVESKARLPSLTFIHDSIQRRRGRGVHIEVELGCPSRRRGWQGQGPKSREKTGRASASLGPGSR